MPNYTVLNDRDFMPEIPLFWVVDDQGNRVEGSSTFYEEEAVMLAYGLNMEVANEQS